jgi:hypothetical protein
MSKEAEKAAIFSDTLRLLTAGGLTLAIAVAQEVAKPDRDWAMIATMLAGIVVGIGGGAYGRVKADAPITSVLPK